MKDGHRSECKSCIGIKNKLRYLSNQEEAKIKQREWNSRNKDIKKIAGRGWYLNNQEKVDQSRRKWGLDNPEKLKEVQKKAWKKYADANRAELNRKTRERRMNNTERQKEIIAKWKQKDPEHARMLSRIASQKIRDTASGTLNCRISAGIRQSLKGSKNGQKWESLVGYTLNDLKKHIESKFKSGMSWNNMGQWHIDHIIPKSAFNYSDSSHIDFKKCWSLKNLQPMWAKDNLKKHNKLEKHFQPSLAI
jgi:hypothetical protein